MNLIGIKLRLQQGLVAAVVVVATLGHDGVHGITTGGTYATTSGQSETNLMNNTNNKKHTGRNKIHDWNHLGLKPPTTPASDYGRGGRARCGMPEPTKEKILHDNAIVQEYIENRRRRAQGEPDTLIVQTCVHVIRPEGDTNDAYLNADMIQLQLDGLNKGFSPTSCCDPSLAWCNGECSLDTGVRFELAVFDANDDSVLTGETVDSTLAPNACHTRSFNNEWYNSEALTEMDIDMRFTLRRGGPYVLNIFFKGGESGLLGIAQFPSDWATQSNTDAVLVGDPYVIGGGDLQYGEGDTLTHEVGHWMGLYHTFQDGCIGGDLVGDTAAEKSPAYGCELGRDTCPGVSGPDPIHNFMDYSDDHCLYEFSENQVNRMFAQFNLYRSGFRQDITLQNGVASEPTALIRYELQTYILQTEPGSQVECTSSGDFEGDIDMYMRDGETPVISTSSFDCYSERGGSTESCSILANSGFAYVSLYAFKGTGDSVVTCTGSEIETATVLSSGVFSAPFDVNPGIQRVFNLPITDPNARVVCLLGTPVADDVTFYLQFDQPPDANTQDFDCSASGSDTCSVVNPGAASVLWAKVTSTAGATGLSFACFSSVPDPIVFLTPNTPSDAQTLNAYEAQTYILSPPEGSIVTCQTTTGQFSGGNMFLRWGTEPDLSSATYDCSVFDLSRSCTVTANPTLVMPELFITVETFETGLIDMQVQCSVSYSSETLVDGVPTTPFDLFNGASKTFSLPVRRGDSITCDLTADNPDDDTVDLYVDFDEPNFGQDCSSISLTNTESCTVENAGSSTELFLVVKSFFPSATGIILTCAITSPPTTEVGDAIALVDGVPSAPFSLADFERESFTLVVEPGARTTCITEGFDGDADLYLRYGSEADLELFLLDCYSFELGSFESCTVRDSGSGSTLWATVEAFSAFTDLTITCTSENVGPPIILQDGVTSGPYELFELEYLDFTLQVAPGERVMCTSTGLFGADSDLILRLGQEVDFFNDDCYSEALGTSEESCAVNVPEGIEVLWVALVGYAARDEVSVTCTRMETVPPPPPISLTDGVPSDPISLDVGLSQSYTYPVSPGTRATCELVPADASSFGDADLYVQFDQEPDTTNILYDCVSADTESFESCSLDVPEGVSILWATIRAYSMFENVVITCFSEDGVALIQLVDGQDSPPLSLDTDNAQAYQLASIESNNVICETRLLVEDQLADADLYVGINAEPDRSQGVFDCSSVTLTSMESCILTNVEPGSTIFATVYAYTGFNDLIVTCSSYSEKSVSDPLQLSDGVTTSPIQLNINQVQDFVFETTDDATCVLQGSTGDADLFLRWTDPPELDVRFPLFDCASESGTSNEECSVVNPGDATTLYAQVYAFQGFTDVSITCTAGELMITTPAPITVAPVEPTASPVDMPTTTTTPAPVDDTPATTPSPVETDPPSVTPITEGGDPTPPPTPPPTDATESSAPGLSALIVYYTVPFGLFCTLVVGFLM